MGLEIENFAIIAIPIIMWVVAQTIKFTIYSYKHGVNWRYLFEYGHMPSSHASCMSSLFFAVGYYEGIDSPIFAVAFIVALITLIDAVKLRSYIGEYGKTINRIIHDAGYSREDYPLLKERVGHTLSEVSSGIIVGTGGAYLLIQLFNLS